MNERPGSALSGSILDIRDLHVYFFTDLGISRALNGVSLQVPARKVLGIVGESGCGKSVTALSVMRLVPKPGRIVSGEIIFRRATGDGASSEGIDLTTLDPMGDDIRAIRGAKITMIFQEPMTSLDPLYRIGNQIAEPLIRHKGMNARAARARVLELLRLVGIPDPERRINAYPHEMSGGQRQRVMIAMAFANDPDILIAD